MKRQTTHEAGPRVWVPMRLSYVSSVGELMRANIVGSRKDNGGAGACGFADRRSGGTGIAC